MVTAEGAAVERWATRHRRAIVSGLRVVLLLWAGSWAVFAVASAIGEGAAGVVPALAFLCLLLGATFVAWRWPKGGGLVLIVAGMVAAWWFTGTAAWLLLAMPAFVLGQALTLIGRVAEPAG